MAVSGWQTVVISALVGAVTACVFWYAATFTQAAFFKYKTSPVMVQPVMTTSPTMDTTSGFTEEGM